jgi:hypothetical protein
VGAYAVGFHGASRATGDIDIPVRPEHEHVVRRRQEMYGGVPVFFIGLPALLANKAAAARAKDVADIKALRRKGTSS